ncbi:MAG: glycosyltransferase family 4 protein [Sarcina sp.]
MKIGLMTEKNTKLKGGPKVFMTRLENELKEQDLHNDINFEKWINLSFRKMPDEILHNNDIEKIIRFDGIWNDSLIPNLRYMPTLKNKLDLIFFKRINKVILDNYNAADKIIYQSEFSKFTIEKLLFERFGVENRNIKSIIIKNGVDLNLFKPMPDLKCKENFPNILISHRLIPFKRAHQSVEIIEKLKEMYPSLKVHVVGGGIKNPYHFNRDSKEEFKELVKRRGLENYYEFYGHINPNELPLFYNKCDFMLNLSYADPCPNVVVESLACGIPVVAPNSGGIPELIQFDELIVEENVNVNEFQPRFIYKDLPQINSGLYVEKINKLIPNLEEVSQKVRVLAEDQYDIKKITQKYIDFIKSDILCEV